MSPTATGRRFAQGVILSHTVPEPREAHKDTHATEIVCAEAWGFGDTQTPYVLVPLAPFWSPLFEAIFWKVPLGQQRIVFTVISLDSLPHMGKGQVSFRDLSLSPQWRGKTPILKT